MICLLILIHYPKNQSQRPALHIWKGLEKWLNLGLHLYSLCMYGWSELIWYIHIYMYIYTEIGNTPNMILDMVTVQSFQRAKKSHVISEQQPYLTPSWRRIWTPNYISVKGKYLEFLGEVHVTTLSGKQHLLHAMWSSFATPERQHHLWNLWMGRNNKSHNSPLKCHQFLERMLSSAILGALVKGPEGNWCWTWSKKVRKTHTIKVPFYWVASGSVLSDPTVGERNPSPPGMY